MPCFWCKIHIMIKEHQHEIVVCNELEGANLELKSYLQWGVYMPNYKRGLRAVYEPELRQKVLNAGFTELAIGCLGGIGITDMTPGEDFPQDPNQKAVVDINAPNRYKIGRRKYDAIEAVRWIIDVNYPDYPNGRDPLRAEILKQQKELSQINLKLCGTSKTQVSPIGWNVDDFGKITFNYNPMENVAMYGKYSIRELQGYANGNKRSVILKANQKKDNHEPSNLSMDEKSAKVLGKLCKRTDALGKRLFRIAMLRASRAVADKFAHHLEYLNKGF